MSENKQVRVDNWGIFFLQRLQLFFSKTDYCDLTLQFRGNVQLKVHRLVLNACTEYFELLEHSDRLVEENVIMMPEMLQADVVVPIINFMYTGMLEYPMNIYHKLYQAADLMRISVLTKLLDAQLQPPKNEKKPKSKPTKPNYETNSVSPPVISPSRKLTPKAKLPELPPTLPGRKVPVWKRKTIPYSSNISSFSHTEPKTRLDSLPSEHAAKPTRFEWPEDDLELPPLEMMDLCDFGDISYTSKPLLREDDVKPVLHSPGSISRTPKVKEEFLNLEENVTPLSSNRVETEKRKLGDSSMEKLPKRIKITENEKDTTISVFSSENSPNFDPTKMVSEILKKYPHLVKKNKNIKLKILSTPNERDNLVTDSSRTKSDVKQPVQSDDDTSSKSPKTKISSWTCKECYDRTGRSMDFALYYLFRKHMTDVHNVKFDPRICKYCGKAFTKNELHSFHSYTKHGVKPSGNQVFPSCPQCPYVAFSKQDLQIHRSKHKKGEMQCTDCKLAFVSSEAITSHVQITRHMGKIKKSIYDCQYCMKTSQSAISLLTHIKSNHKAEGKRDGIVCLDEVDIDEGDDIAQVEEGAAEGEYIVPDIPQEKKVKIISDVKVPQTKNMNGPEVVSLDASRVNTVPTSIATSLGLLDIVVLDENQQLISQNPDQQSGHYRTEYILPQIASNTVVQDGGLGASSDELVMVLTDQDYKEGHSAISADNSNIVVLYSHPADGQEGQFITSQGNLMVNSETGLLEIRNGATIATTSANPIVMQQSHPDHMETIEMIQREIAETRGLKQEPFFEEDRKPQLSQATKESSNYLEIEHVEQQQSNPEMHKIQKSNENCSIGHDTPPVTGIMNETVEESSSISSVDEIESIETFEEIRNKSTDEMRSQENYNEATESNVVDNTVNESLEVKSSETSVSEEKASEQQSTEEEKGAEEAIVFNDDRPNLSDNDSSQTCGETQTTCIVASAEVSMEIDERIEKEETTKEKDITDSSEPKAAEVEQHDSITENNSEAPDMLLQNVSMEDADTPYSPTDKPIDIEGDCESCPDTSEKQDEESTVENGITAKDNSNCESEVTEQVGAESNERKAETDVQENDECQQSPQEQPQVQQPDSIQNVVDDSTKESTKTFILDDWEDTDSQQSDNKSKQDNKVAEETVHKLMNDWEEEDVEK